ncbi:MAG: hypothetical protein QW569_04615 [Candidatus Bathyarchaeia archaeon]|nr:hypothetical protein [Candidatus Bathyarchaeota archaeon]
MGKTFPRNVIAKGGKGRPEVRVLESRGSYVIYKYLDLETLEQKEKKLKLCLKDGEGKVAEYFIVPLKDDGRYLLIRSEEKGPRKIWNPKRNSEEDLWIE